LKEYDYLGSILKVDYWGPLRIFGLCP